MPKSVFTQHLHLRTPGSGSHSPRHRAPQMLAWDASQLKPGETKPHAGRGLAPASLLPAQTEAPNELSAQNFNMLKMTVGPASAFQHLMLQELQPPGSMREEERADVMMKGPGLTPSESLRSDWSIW